MRIRHCQLCIGGHLNITLTVPLIVKYWPEVCRDSKLSLLPDLVFYLYTLTLLITRQIQWYPCGLWRRHLSTGVYIFQNGKKWKKLDIIMQLFYSFYLEIIEFPQFKKKNRKQIFSAPRKHKQLLEENKFQWGEE